MLMPGIKRAAVRSRTSSKLFSASCVWYFDCAYSLVRILNVTRSMWASPNIFIKLNKQTAVRRGSVETHLWKPCVILPSRVLPAVYNTASYTYKPLVYMASYITPLETAVDNTPCRRSGEEADGGRWRASGPQNAHLFVRSERFSERLSERFSERPARREVEGARLVYKWWCIRSDSLFVAFVLLLIIRIE